MRSSAGAEGSEAAAALPNDKTTFAASSALLKRHLHGATVRFATLIYPDVVCNETGADLSAPAAAPGAAKPHSIRTTVSRPSSTLQRHRGIDPRAPHWRDGEVQVEPPRASKNPVEKPDPVGHKFGGSGHRLSAYTGDRKPRSAPSKSSSTRSRVRSSHDQKRRSTIKPPSFQRIMPTDTPEAPWKKWQWHDIEEEDRARTIELVNSGKNALGKACAVGLDKTQQIFGDLWNRHSTAAFKQPNDVVEEFVGTSSLVDKEEEKEMVTLQDPTSSSGRSAAVPAQVSAQDSQEVSDYFSSLLEKEDETVSLADPAQALQEVSDCFSGLLEKEGNVVASTTQDLHPVAVLDDPAQVSKEVVEYFSGLLEKEGNVIVESTTMDLHPVADLDEGGVIVESTTQDSDLLAELDERATNGEAQPTMNNQNRRQQPKTTEPKTEVLLGSSTQQNRGTTPADWSEIEPGEPYARVSDCPKVYSGPSTQHEWDAAPADWLEIEPGEQSNRPTVCSCPLTHGYLGKAPIDWSEVEPGARYLSCEHQGSLGLAESLDDRATVESALSESVTADDEQLDDHVTVESELAEFVTVELAVVEHVTAESMANTTGKNWCCGGRIANTTNKNWWCG